MVDFLNDVFFVRFSSWLLLKYHVFLILARNQRIQLALIQNDQVSRSNTQCTIKWIVVFFGLVLIITAVYYHRTVGRCRHTCSFFLQLLDDSLEPPITSDFLFIFIMTFLYEIAAVVVVVVLVVVLLWLWAWCPSSCKRGLKWYENSWLESHVSTWVDMSSC